MKALIVYFSRKGENYFDGEIKTIEKGNTEVLAEKIAELTGGELFKVIPVKPYSSNYELCVDETKEDKAKNTRPEIVNYLDNIDAYDTIYIGYPNYWGTMPMHMFTLLERLDFNGKTVKPFCTHAGSGLGNSIEDIKVVCKGGEVKEGFSASGSSVYELDETKIRAWIG